MDKRIARAWFYKGCDQEVYEVARVYEMEVDEAASMLDML